MVGPMGRILIFIFWVFLMVWAYLPPAEADSLRSRVLRTETFPLRLIVGIGDRALTPERARLSTEIALSQIKAATGVRARIVKVERIRASNHPLDINNYLQSYANALRPAKKRLQRDGNKYALNILVMPPLAYTRGDSLIRHAIGGEGEGRCTLWQYGLGRNYIIAFAQEESDYGEPRWLHSITLITHELIHGFGGGHRKGYNVMNPDALSLVEAWLLPILPQSVREVKKCVARFR